MSEFDPSQLEKLADTSVENRVLLDILVEDFINHGGNLVVKMIAAAQEGHAEVWRDGAHAMRSPCLTLGLVGLERLCRELENGNFSQEALAFKMGQLRRLFLSAQQWLESRNRASKAS